MTRLLHLTDLHFGAERRELIAPLQAAIAELAPDGILVSGDLTHRARPGQFRAAVGFLAGLGPPVIAVPGNHDVPLWNLPLRLTAPFRRWHRGVPAEMGCGPAEMGGGPAEMRGGPVVMRGVPAEMSGGPAVIGDFHVFVANTADPWRIRPGVLRDPEVAGIATALGVTPGGALNLLLCHHPLEEPPGFNRGETRGATDAMARLVPLGLSVALTGHLHHWQMGLGVTHDNARPLLQIQTGSALCARPGEKDHGFTVLDSAAPDLIVTPWLIDEGTVRFRPVPAIRFSRGPAGWLRADD